MRRPLCCETAYHMRKVLQYNTLNKCNLSTQLVGTGNRTAATSSLCVFAGLVETCGSLQVDILDLKPRINPSTGKAYGSNAAASWGYQFVAGFLDGIKREVITIYE